MFNRTVKITDLSATTTSNLFTWYPKVKVTMKFTDDVASQLAWRGTYLVKGRFSTGDVVGCVVDQVVQANQTFTCDMPTVGFAKLKRRYVEFDIISVGEAANITFDATGTNRFGIRF